MNISTYIDNLVSDSRNHYDEKHTIDDLYPIVAKIINGLDTVNGDEMFNDMLDECNEEVNICGYKYSPSYALKEIDPTAYRCGMADYLDSCSCDDTIHYIDLDDCNSNGEYIYDFTMDNANSDIEEAIEKFFADMNEEEEDDNE